jgi:hypothetical protein
MFCVAYGRVQCVYFSPPSPRPSFLPTPHTLIRTRPLAPCACCRVRCCRLVTFALGHQLLPTEVGAIIKRLVALIACDVCGALCEKLKLSYRCCFCCCLCLYLSRRQSVVLSSQVIARFYIGCWRLSHIKLVDWFSRTDRRKRAHYTNANPDCLLFLKREG